MKSSSFNPLASRRIESAFTILEILVAATVMVIIVGIMAQIVSSASTSITSSEGRNELDAEARIILDRLGQDIARMPLHRDAFYSFDKATGNDSMLFFSENRGTVSASAEGESAPGRSAFSTVSYVCSGTAFLGKTYYPGTVMARASTSRPWNNPMVFLNDGTPNAGSIRPSVSDHAIIGSQVFRFEYTYLLKPQSPGSSVSFSNYPSHAGINGTINGFEDVKAIVVGIALLDRNARKQGLNPDGLIVALPDSSGGSDIMRDWSIFTQDPNFYQDERKRGIRVYQRYYHLNH